MTLSAETLIQVVFLLGTHTQNIAWDGVGGYMAGGSEPCWG